MKHRTHLTNERIGIYSSVFMTIFLLFATIVTRCTENLYLIAFSGLFMYSAFFAMTAACIAERQEHHKTISYIALGASIAVFAGEVRSVFSALELEEQTARLMGLDTLFLGSSSYFFMGLVLFGIGILTRPHSRLGVLRRYLHIAAFPIGFLFEILRSVLEPNKLDTDTVWMFIWIVILIGISLLNLKHFLKLEAAMRDPDSPEERMKETKLVMKLNRRR